MIKFNELKIDKEGKNLIIDVSLIDLPYFTNMYISEIIIDTQDTYKSGIPSEKAIKVLAVEGDQKNARIELNKSNFIPDLKSNLFFVYIKVKGTPDFSTPCGMDKEYTLGVVFYDCIIYNHIMNSIRSTTKDCNIPKEFIDSFLRIEAFLLSIKTEHYIESINFYNKYIKNLNKINTNNICNCNG